MESELTQALVSIEATKEGVKFACSGDIGNGAVTLRSHTNVEKPEQNVEIALSEPVSLTFSLKYLVNFCKASGLSSTVKLCLSNEVPLLVEYSLASNSYLRFYLAPKVCLSHSSTFGCGRRRLTTIHRLVMTNKRFQGIYDRWSEWVCLGRHTRLGWVRWRRHGDFHMMQNSQGCKTTTCALEDDLMIRWNSRRRKRGWA